MSSNRNSSTVHNEKHDKKRKPEITPPEVFGAMLRSAIVTFVLVVVGWFVVSETLPMLSAPPIVAQAGQGENGLHTTQLK